MSKKILLAGAFAILPFAAFAQGGAVTGGAAGAATGAIVGGPVGAVVGGVTGAIAGGIADQQQQAQFRQYVVTQGVPSYRVQEQVQVGAVLPQQGVTYYEVPAQFGVQGYRYTVVNETPVLVEPQTRRIVQVIR